MMNSLRSRTLLAALLALPSPAFCEDAFDFFREEASVYTVSRRKESALRAPASVTVITAEDIRASGAQTIWDALSSRVGIDALDGRSADGSRGVVAVRGLPSEFVANLLVLLDGMPVYSPFAGGTYWTSLPVQLPDIERIEVVRGPAAALYGSNAALGVINIISKRPSRGVGGEGKSEGGSQSSSRFTAAGEAGSKKWGLRVSGARYETGGHVSAAGGSANDFLLSRRVNAALETDIGASDTLTMRLGLSEHTLGIPGFTGDPMGRQRVDFQSFKFAHRFNEGHEAELLASRLDSTISATPYYLGEVAVRTYEYNLDALHRLSWLDGRLDTQWGGNMRFQELRSDQVFSGRPRQSNRILRGHLTQTARPTDAITLLGAYSLEDSDVGGTQPAWQGTLLVEPVQETVARFSYARATTMPSFLSKAADYRINSGVKFVGNTGLTPEVADNYEVSLRKRWPDGVEAEGVLFYTDISDMQRTRVNGVIFAPGAVVVLKPDNGNRTRIRGAELELRAKPTRNLTLLGQYTYIYATDGLGSSALYGANVAHLAPRHKTALTARWDAKRWSFASTLSWKDAYALSATSRGTLARVPATHRLDLRVAYRPVPACELFVSGDHLLLAYRNEFPDTTATPRSVQGGVTWRFGSLAR